MNRIIFYFTTIIFTLMIPIQEAHLQGYRIKTTISGMSDSSLILSYRHGTKFFSLDTAQMDGRGIAIFKDTASIKRGMYQVILPDKSFVEFFVDQSTDIEIITAKDRIVADLSSPNSKSNQYFFDWQAKNQDLRRRADALQRRMKSAPEGSAEQADLQKFLDKLREENKALWDSSIENLEGSLAGKFLAGMRPFDVPPHVTEGVEESKKQMARYNYYKNHFFDYIDFSDPGLIRTPLIHTKLDQFFTNVVPNTPDSVIHYSDRVIERSAAEPEMFQFVVQFLLNRYSDPKIMGMDAVYVHIGEKYYMSGLATWVDESNLNLIKDRVKTLKPLLIGSPAPKLTGIETPEGEPIILSDIDAKLTILYFWEPDCSFCKTATPKLMSIYKNLKPQGIEVLAINTRLEKDLWNDFIAEHELTWINVYSPLNVREILTNYEAFSTPKLFILDENKNIVAKDIGVDQVNQIIDYLSQKK